MTIPHAWREAKPGQRCQGRSCSLKAHWALEIAASRSGVEVYCDRCARQVAGELGIAQPVPAQGYVVFLVEEPDQLAWASGSGTILFSSSATPWVYPSVDDALRIRALAEVADLKAGVRPHPSRAATLRDGQPSTADSVHAHASQGTSGEVALSVKDAASACASRCGRGDAGSTPALATAPDGAGQETSEPAGVVTASGLDLPIEVGPR